MIETKARHKWFPCFLNPEPGVTIVPGNEDVSEYRHHGLEARATKYSQPEALTGMMGTSRPSQAYLSSIFHR